MNYRIGRMIKDAYFRVRTYYPVKINSFRFQCDPQNRRFWRSVSKGRWESDTFHIFEKYLDSDFICCDIGAWIGPTTLYAARKCKKVYCFEPDMVAYRSLLKNIYSNSLYNVIPLNVALTPKSGIREMSSFGSSLGDSKTSLLAKREGKGKESTDVYCMSWDDWISLYNPDHIDFMKIDIEGGEFDFIPSIKEYLRLYRPIVYLSLHAPYLENEVREEKVQDIIDAMGDYNRCYNEKLQLIDPKELLNKESLHDFTSYVFCD